MKFKLLLSLTILAMGMSGCSQFGLGSKSEPAPDIMDFYTSISADSMKTDLTVISSDEMEGRDTGSEGIKKAEDYLIARYKDIGLKPVGDNGTYRQTFELHQNLLDSIRYTVYDENEAMISQQIHTPTSPAGYLTVNGGSKIMKGDIVFTGTGSFSEETGINHFDGDLDGKWMLMFYDREYSSYDKMIESINNGALGALLILSPEDEDDFESASEVMQASFGRVRGRLTLNYLEQRKNKTEASTILRVSNLEAQKLLGLANLGELLEQRESILENIAAFKPIDNPFTLRIKPYKGNSLLKSLNVVALIEGSDPVLKDEYVVLTSHHDHLGISTADENGDKIYNGADDDGSGTVGILHTAEALMRAKEAGLGPRRSVLVLHVSGEEKGLLGSRFYSDHPIFPIENTIANVNLDMIGRIDESYDIPDFEKREEYIYIIGSEIISSGFDSLLKAANSETVDLVLDMKYNDLEDRNQFYRRSDHWNFGRLGVPFVFFFNGTHADYHKRSDEVDKIEFEALKKRTQLVYALTVKLANAENRPIVDNRAFIDKTKSQPRN